MCGNEEIISQNTLTSFNLYHSVYVCVYMNCLFTLHNLFIALFLCIPTSTKGKINTDYRAKLLPHDDRQDDSFDSPHLLFTFYLGFTVCTHIHFLLCASGCRLVQTANTDDHCDSWHNTKEETPCCKQVNLLLASHYYSSWNKAQSRLDPSDQVCFFVVCFSVPP